MVFKSKSFTPAMDMKTVLATMAGRIANMSNEVMSTNDNPSLRGWISLIKAYEAIMMHFLKEKYFEDKKVVLEKIKDKENVSRELRFEVWLEVFSLLAKEMGQFGAFPMTFFEEAEEQEHPEYIFEDDMEPDELERLKANL